MTARPSGSALQTTPNLLFSHLHFSLYQCCLRPKADSEQTGCRPVAGGAAVLLLAGPTRSAAAIFRSAGQASCQISSLSSTGYCVVPRASGVLSSLRGINISSFPANSSDGCVAPAIPAAQLGPAPSSPRPPGPCSHRRVTSRPGH